MLKPAQIRIELVTRNESGSDPAGDRPQFVVTDQRANVVLGAVELRGNLANCGGPATPCAEYRYRSDVESRSAQGSGFIPSTAQATRSRLVMP